MTIVFIHGQCRESREDLSENDVVKCVKRDLAVGLGAGGRFLCWVGCERSFRPFSMLLDLDSTVWESKESGGEAVREMCEDLLQGDLGSICGASFLSAYVPRSHDTVLWNEQFAWTLMQGLFMIYSEEEEAAVSSVLGMIPFGYVVACDFNFFTSETVFDLSAGRVRCVWVGYRWGRRWAYDGIFHDMGRYKEIRAQGGYGDMVEQSSFLIGQ